MRRFRSFRLKRSEMQPSKRNRNWRHQKSALIVAHFTRIPGPSEMTERFGNAPGLMSLDAITAQAFPSDCVCVGALNSAVHSFVMHKRAAHPFPVASRKASPPLMRSLTSARKRKGNEHLNCPSGPEEGGFCGPRHTHTHTRTKETKNNGWKYWHSQRRTARDRENERKRAIVCFRKL